jgi:HEAT repeat protein
MAAALMKKRSSFFVMIPLGAGLLFLGSFAFDPPGAVMRPAPSFTLLVNGEPFSVEPEIDVQKTVASIDIEPAKAVFLETVVLQGSFGDRKAAIRELRRLGNGDAIAALSIALGDNDRRVRKAALEALSRIGGDEALAAIASAANDFDPPTRARAAESLVYAGGYSAVDYLELALRDDDARVRATATEALGDLGDGRSINIISTALRDPDPEVRQRAVEMLDQLNDDALFHALYPAQ